jgi:hypothetical protein
LELARVRAPVAPAGLLLTETAAQAVRVQVRV